MEKVYLLDINIHNNASRFIVLTNKNLFAFTNDDKDADCTMNLILQTCGRVEVCDDLLGKDNTFVSIQIN
jgi:hypothetical protein